MSARPVSAATPEQVDAAVDKAVAFILSQQEADGSWEGGKQKNGMVKKAAIYFGGETAAAVYALLAAGVSPQTPAMKKAIQWLETNDAHGTYVVGLRAGVWSQLPEQWRDKDKSFAMVRDHDRDFALYSRVPGGINKGFYGYTYGDNETPSLGNAKGFAPYDKSGPPEGAHTDHSNSQYGVFAAWGVEQAGAEVPTQYWLDEDAAWKKVQLSDGGWDYREGGKRVTGATYTMTCAGLATLFITQDYVLRSNGHQFDTCKGGVTNTNIEKGLAWMDTHIAASIRGGRREYYGLYGIERVGVASGRKYFGPVDWYKTGADLLVTGQSADGGWGFIHDTCFATVFLCRGRAPVIMNKLLYQSAVKKQTDPWNERPRDAANLAKWMGRHSLESFLNWQIVTLKVPVEELHDSPILYISGSEELAFSDQDQAKLRLFVEEGGLILGNADCGSASFSASYRKLAHALFPKYEFRQLPPSHPIFDEQYHATKWKSQPVVEGLSNGVRELMLLIPQADVGRAWQTESTKVREETFQLGDNIFLYANGKDNLTHKGDTYIVTPQGGAAGRQIKLARLQIGDNFDPEPGAWRRMSAILHNSRHVDVTAEPVTLGSGALASYKIADLTGTTKIQLSAGQRGEIKDFVEKGGTLIIDAAGGSTLFADSIEAELKQIFGDAATKGLSEALPPDHALFSAAEKIEQIRYRPYARQRLVGGAQTPQIRGIAVTGGRIGVFYSREDLTAGAVGEPVDGILGYDPKIAAKLLTNLLMYADAGGKAPAPVISPTTAPANPEIPATVRKGTKPKIGE